MLVPYDPGFCRRRLGTPSMRELMEQVQPCTASPDMLLETVLYRPVAAALAPYMAEMPNPAVQKWFLTNFGNWLAKQPGNLHKLTYAPPDATEKQKKALAFDDLYDLRLTPESQTLIAHLLDFFKANPSLPRLDRMSVEQVEAAAEQWVKALHARAAKTPDDPKQVRTLMTFPNGFRVVELLGAAALDKEGARMGHCVGGYCDDVTSGKTRIFSLRDADDEPHATIELAAAPHTIEQIKGRQNAAPVPRYWSMIRQFLDSLKAEISGDYQNIGLLSIYDDDTGEQTLLTQEQFRDLVLDPASPKGAKYRDLAGSDARHMTADELIGLFGALYGSPRLTVWLVRGMFRIRPGLAVQTIAHYGNRLDSEQLVAALDSLSVHQRNFEALKQMLRLTKPDVATAERVAKTAPDRFMAALAQELPQTYAAMLEADPQAVERELAQGGLRAAAPFFVFAGTPRLTPEMVEAAFDASPADAWKRIKRLKLTLSKDDVIAALIGLSGQFRYTVKTAIEVLDGLVEYTRPDAAVLKAALRSDLIKSTASASFVEHLLHAAAAHVPDALTQPVVEQSLMQIDHVNAYRDYFSRQPQPSTELQTHLFDSHEDYLHYVSIIDPALFPLAYQKLRPAAVETSTQEMKSSHKNGKTKHYTITRDKTAEELAAERGRARNAAITAFTETLAPLLREPTQATTDPIDPAAPKAQAARRAFAAMGKEALLDTAIKYINLRAVETRIVDTGRSWRAPIDLAELAKHAATLPIKSLAMVISHDYSRQSFGVLVDAAPERVPDLLKYWHAHEAGAGNPWGDFKAPVDKDKAFAALGAVWHSTVPDDLKDQFAEVVLKRFKPAADKVLDMLKAANNADVTRKILKKTRRPSDELIDFVAATSPGLLIDVPNIPDASLVKIFRDQPVLAQHLMDRDLRGYAPPPGSRSKWATRTFQKRLDRHSEVFQHYAKVAAAAGKTAMFDRYAHQAELAEALPKADAATIAANLDAYSTRSLLDIARDDNKFIARFFNRFTAKKLAALVDQGLLRDQWDSKITLEGINPRKLRETLEALLQAGSQQVERMVNLLLAAGFAFDDELILRVLQSDAFQDETSLAGRLMGKLESPAAKDAAADAWPYEIAAIRRPTPHVVRVLFDRFAAEKPNLPGDMPYFFKTIVLAWFSLGKHSHEFRANPVAAHLIKAEAVRRGGKALTLTRRMFQELRRRAAASAQHHFADDADVG